jgi:hypothetical protein
MITVDGLPASIRVGPYDIKIETLDEKSAEDKYGEFGESEHTIWLRPEFISGPVAVDSILHEIFHAIWCVGAIKQEHGEEQIVTVQATGLTQILRDNPLLTAWIAKALGA